MPLTVNGRPVPDREGATVLELLTDLGVPPGARGVAVAVNGEVVPRSAWPDHRVGGEDRVEALQAMQGG